VTASRLARAVAIAAGLSLAALIHGTPAHAADATTGEDDARLQQMPFQRGETAYVSVDDADFVDSNHTLIAKLAKGTPFDVASTAVAWVGGYVEIDGRRRMGWIHARHLAATPPGAPSPSPH
jgi:hypothetical protein